MKRIFLWMMAVCCAATIFSRCSDDDNDGDDGNGKGPGNGGSGVTVLSKRVAKIQRLDEQGNADHTYLFSYDAEGKLIKIISHYSWATDEYEKTFTYANNKITITEDDGEESIIDLKDGKATSVSESDGSNWKYEYTFSYSDGYLSKVQMEEKDLQNGVWTKSSEQEDTYTVKNGNLQTVKSTWKSGNDQDNTMTTCTYGDVANNANIDLGYICYDMEGEG